MFESNFTNPENYINRELSWLEFNDRVLEEAKDRNNPLLERVKFLAITGSNLDEFFMVRVASLKDMVDANFNRSDYAGLTPKQQLKKISVRAHMMVEAQYNTFNRSLLPLLAKTGIHILHEKDLSKEQKEFLEEYFENMVYPVLSPMAVDSGRPFPLILNRSLNIGALIKKKETEPLEVNGRGKSKEKNQGKETVIFATVQVPSVLSRIVELPNNKGNGGRYFIYLEEVITMFIDKLFTNREIVSTFTYRITRNADLSIDEDEADDLLLEIEKSLKKRRWGSAIRLEIDANVDEMMLKALKEPLEVTPENVYFITGPLDLTFLNKIYSLKGYDDLKYQDYEPQLPLDLWGEEDIFETIKKKDVFLHHPYDSFEPVTQFIEKASRDPDVLAIKQTLYRVSGNSPIIKALAQAAESGKQVMVLVEVKARFDEENNIQWAKRLEQAGCHVIYGLVGLKTHSKLTLVVRREDNGIKRYVHLGTGNYNDITARFYTDMGLFTSDEYFGTDASAFFNMISGYSEAPEWHKLEAAPIGLRARFLELIENEVINALSGKKAMIIAKMNSLVDSEIIAALYRASAAGVKIELIVRGICSLRPGLKGISENITVRSIVGRFLEHSRIYYFYNDGREDLFLSSADWMPRNLDRRVEILFPIEDGGIKSRVINILDLFLNDTVKARILDSEGNYSRVDKRGRGTLEAQSYLCEKTIEEAGKYKKSQPTPNFEAIRNLDD